jgi:hypothetical protein
MLFLASLSESDARWWLGASELLLLAATILLVAGLIGEWSDSESWKKRKLYKLAKLAVILGVAGEFFGDAGIFETSARLQTVEEAKVSNANTKAADAIERAARVEQAAAWRILDRERFLKLKSALAGNPARPVTLGYAVGDPESITFASQILAAFEGTNWQVLPVGHWYESELVSGVRVLGSDVEGADLIKQALTSAKIPFSIDPVPIPGMYAHPPTGVPDEKKLLLYLGTKPPPKF